MKHQQKDYRPWIPEIEFSSWPKFVSGKTCFYLHARLGGAQMKHRQKAYGPWIPEIEFSSWPKFVSLLQRP
jgi:hypothetical protein